MYGAEGVGYVYICQRSQFLGEVGVVLFFFLMETQILEKQYFAFPELACHLFGLLANAVRRKADPDTRQQLLEPFRYGSEGKLHLALTLGPAQMGAEYDLCTVLEKILYSGQRRCYALVVRYFSVLKGYVEVDPYQHPFALYVYVLNGLLCHNIFLNLQIRSAQRQLPLLRHVITFHIDYFITFAASCILLI